MSSDPLPFDVLRRFEAEYARSVARPKYWEGVNHSVNALGKMIDIVWEKRKSLARHNRELEAPSQAAVARNLGLNARDLSAFLNGHLAQPGEWVSVGRGILKLILLGQGKQPSQQQLEVFERIEMLFFHYSLSQLDAAPNKRWYFDGRLRDSSKPETSIEGAQEVRAIAAMTDGLLGTPCNGRIVRCSGARAFPVFDKKGAPLFATTAMIAALRSGVRVQLVYPSRAQSDAERTAKEFKSLANADPQLGASNALVRDLLRPIDAKRQKKVGGRIARAGQWLGPEAFIFVYHYCQPTNRSDHAGLRGWSTLMVSRDPTRGYGPSAFTADTDEVKEFEQWLDVFVK